MNEAKVNEKNFYSCVWKAFRAILQGTMAKTPLPCPCMSHKPYEECCAPYHKGAAPPTAVALMRSRFSAYALGKVDYLVETTHPESPQIESPLSRWKEEISLFSQKTRFADLEILSTTEHGSCATVRFRATLFQGKKEVSFTEESFFLKVEGRWLYLKALSYEP